ncbi:MAG: hypothetical protein IT203_01725 [Fimbriimonadaceae bacterium]|nr:hypothetical protein [Fimbriimonadaceae bacterium]
MLGFEAEHRESYVTMPPRVSEELPAGISLELLLLEVRQALRTTAFPFSINPKRFDLVLDEALAVVHLTDEGFGEQASWWVAREASVSNCVDAIPDLLE